jgi:hypothetical protein
MLRFVLALLLPAPVAQAGTVPDSAGRTVEVPDEIRTVFAAGPPATHEVAPPPPSLHPEPDRERRES